MPTTGISTPEKTPCHHCEFGALITSVVLLNIVTALHSVEILPYHSTGNAKYARLGRRVPRLET